MNLDVRLIQVNERLVKHKLLVGVADGVETCTGNTQVIFYSSAPPPTCRSSLSMRSGDPGWRRPTHSCLCCTCLLLMMSHVPTVVLCVLGHVSLSEDTG